MIDCKTGVLAAIVLAFGASSATAAPVVTFSGVLNDVYLSDSPALQSEAGFSSLPVTYVGTATLDSTDVDLSPDAGQYAVLSYDFSLSNGLSFSSATANGTSYATVINDSGFDLFSIGFNGITDVLPNFAGNEYYFLSTYLMFPEDTFSSDGIPVFLPPSAFYRTGQFNLMTDDFLQLGVNDSSYSLANLGIAGVPEPSIWAMMIFGFGLVGGAMRRRFALGSLRQA